MKGKRILSFILALVMVFGMIPFNALEVHALATPSSDGKTLEILDGTVTHKELTDLMDFSLQEFYYSTDGSSYSKLTYGSESNSVDLKSANGKTLYLANKSRTSSNYSVKKTYTIAVYHNITLTITGSENGTVTYNGTPLSSGTHKIYTGGSLVITPKDDTYEATIVGAYQNIDDSGTLSVTFKSKETPKHEVSLSPNTQGYGTTTLDLSGQQSEGQTITITADPNDPVPNADAPHTVYYVQSVSVKDADGKDVAVTSSSTLGAVSATYTGTFTVGTKDVTVTVTYGCKQLTGTTNVQVGFNPAKSVDDQLAALKQAIFDQVVTGHLPADTTLAAGNLDYKYYPWTNLTVLGQSLGTVNENEYISAVTLNAAADSWEIPYVASGSSYALGSYWVTKTTDADGNVTNWALSGDCTEKVLLTWGEVSIEANIILVDNRNKASLDYTKPAGFTYETEDEIVAAIRNATTTNSSKALVITRQSDLPTAGNSATVTYKVSVAEDQNYLANEITVTVDVTAKANPSTVNITVVGEGTATVGTITGTTGILGAGEYTVTATPAAGYYVKSISVRKAAGINNSVSVTHKERIGTAAITLENATTYTVTVTFEKSVVEKETVGQVLMNGNKYPADQESALRDGILAAMIQSYVHNGTVTIEIYDTGTTHGWHEISDFNSTGSNWGTTMPVNANSDVRITFAATDIHPEVVVEKSVYFAESRPAPTITQTAGLTSDDPVSFDTMPAEGDIKGWFTVTGLNGATVAADSINVTINPAELGADSNVAQAYTVTVAVADNANSVEAAAQSFTVYIKNPLYNAEINYNNDTNATVVVKDSEGNTVTSGAEVAPGTYTVIVTPNSGYFVTGLNADEASEKWEDCVYTATVNVAPGTTDVNEVTFVADVQKADIILKDTYGQVSYNPATDATGDGWTAFLGRVFSAVVSSSNPTGIVDEEWSVEFVTRGITLDAYNTFVITWKATDKHPQVTKEVSVYITGDKQAAVITAPASAEKITLTEATTVAELKTLVENAAKNAGVTVSLGASELVFTMDNNAVVPVQGETKNITVTITCAENDNYLAATPVTITVPVYGNVTAPSVTVNAGDHGTVAGIATGAAAGSYEVTVTPADGGYYVDQIKVNGTVINGDQNTVSYTWTQTIADGTGLPLGEVRTYTIDVTYGRRTITLNELGAGEKYTIAIVTNPDFKQPSDQRQTIYDQVLAAVVASTSPANISTPTVYYYTGGVAGIGAGYYNVLTSGLLDSTFNDATETIKIEYPASGKYPAVSVEGISVAVTDSRPNVTITEGKIEDVNYDEKTATGTLEDTIKAAVKYTVSGTNGTGWNAPVLTIDNTTLPTAAGETKNVKVTITVAENENYLETTKVVYVSTTLANQPSSLSYTGDGTVKFYSDAACTEETEITSSLAGTVYFKVTPNAGKYVASVKLGEQTLSGTYDGTVFSGSFTVESNSAYTLTVACGSQQIPVKQNPGMSINGFSIDTMLENFTKDNVLAAIVEGYTTAKSSEYKVEMLISSLDRYVDVSNADVLRGLVNTTGRNPISVGSTETIKITWTEPVAGKPVVEAEVTLTLTDSRKKVTENSGYAYDGDDTKVVEAELADRVTVAVLKSKGILTLPANIGTATLTIKNAASFPGENETKPVTYVLHIEENEHYLETEVELDIQVKNPQHLTKVTVSTVSGVTIKVYADQALTQEVANDTSVLTGTYYVVVTPEDTDGTNNSATYVQAVTVSGAAGINASGSYGTGYAYTQAITITNDGIVDTTATIGATTAVRAIPTNAGEYVVSNEDYNTNMKTAILEKVVSGSVNADEYEVELLETEVKLGQKNNFKIIWKTNDAAKYPNVSLVVEVTVSAALLETEIENPTNINAGSLEALIVDANDAQNANLQTEILNALKASGIIEVSGSKEEIQLKLADGETWPTITKQGQTADVTLNIYVAAGNGYNEATSTITITLVGEVKDPEVTIVTPANGVISMVKASNSGVATADITNVYEAGKYIVTLTPNTNYFIDTMTVALDAQIPVVYNWNQFADNALEIELEDGAGNDLGVVPAYTITAAFIDPSIKIDVNADDETPGVMTYYPNMFGTSVEDEETYKKLEELVMGELKITDVPGDLPAGGVNEITYLARPADSYHVSFNVEIPIVGVRTLSGDVPMDALWLNIGEDFPTELTAPTQETIQSLFNAVLEDYSWDYLLSLMDDANKDKRDAFIQEVLMKNPEISDYIKYYGAHEFGAGDTETIKLSNDSKRFGVVECDAPVTLTLDDDRLETKIFLKQDSVQMPYGFTEADLTAAILDGVYANGTKIDGASIKYITPVKGLSVAETAYTITVEYPGEPLKYQDCSETFTLTVVKADVDVAVDNRLIKWEQNLSYEMPVIVTPADCEVITFIVGLDVSNVNFEGVKVQGIMGEVQLMIPDSLNSVLKTVGIQNGMSMTVSELKELLLKAAEGLGYINSENEAISVLLNMLESLPTDVADVTVRIGGDLPTGIGVYLVGAVAADANYNTDYAVGALVISPDGIKVDLAWNQNDDNYIVTNTLLTTVDADGKYLFDTAAHATAVGEGGNLADATAQIVELFLGVDIDGNITIETDQTKLNVGAYVEVAMTADWGNSMYYSRPIARPIVVVAESLVVDFVDENGVNNERHFEFFNVPQDGMEGKDNLLVTYKKDGNGYSAGDKVTDYTVKYYYVGVQTNAVPYASTTAPTHAGAYTITAIVTVRDANGTITHAGQGIGALVIEPSESTTNVENEAIKWDDTGHTVNQFVDADSVNVPGLTPDTTVISAGIHADLNANIGLNAIKGSVNVDMPSWLDNVLNKLNILDAGYADGITAETFLSYVEKLEAAIAEQGIETKAFAKIVSVIKQLPGKTTLTFHDNKGYKEVGAYLIVGIVTDSDHWPSADAGLMVIYPDATKVDLKFDKTWDDNNVFTWNVLQQYDLNAKAYDLGTNDVNDNATDKVTNLFVGFADHGELVLTADKAELDNGVYAQVAFILDLSNAPYYAEPIAREVIIVPNPATIDFVEENGDVNNARHFEFFNKPWAMDRIKVTLADGAELILTAEDAGVDIYYAGVQSNGMPYASYDAPVHAGVYEVTAQYTTRDAQNRVVNLGIGIGALVIEPSKSDTAVDNAAYPYGQTYHVGDLVHAVSVNVPAITPDTTVISTGLSANLDTISGLASINGTVNVDLPNWMDEVLNKLDILETGYADGISAQTFLFYVDKLQAALTELGVDTAAFDEIVNIVEQLPVTTKLTFKDNIGYTEVGAYLVIAVVTDSDHYPSVGAGIMVIYPDATKAELQFEEDWNDNNIFTWSALQNMNLEAVAYVNGVYSDEATKHVTNLYVGFTSDGTVMLEAVSYGEHVKDLPEFKNGVYSQVAVLLDVSNTPYYAEPISRAFAIVPNPAIIDFVDEAGQVNNNRHFVFNNQPHAMNAQVVVNGVALQDLSGLTITYTGVQTNGELYNSTVAPVHAGAYVVTATYTARDDLDRLVTLGAKVGAMVIEPAKADIDVVNRADVYVENQKHDTASMITVSSDVNVTVDKTIITVTLNTDGSFSETGLNAIQGAVNMDLPKWLDDVMANYTIFNGELSVSEFAVGVESVKAELAELGIDTEILDRLVQVTNQFPADAVVTFHDQADVAPTAVGAYLVIGVVTDPNFYPAMDAGLLVIYPDVQKTTLNWIYEDANNNNIYTEDTLDKFDLGAEADIAEAAEWIKTLFIGVDVQNWKIALVDSQDELHIGVYEEFAFVKPNVNSTIYYAEPINRPIIVVANVYNVSIHDMIVTHQFDNTPKDMGEITVSTVSGAVVDTSKGTLTVTYVGIDSQLRPYYSTEKPVHAGTYTVIATYVGTDDDGDQTVGVGVGQLIILPADAEISVNSHAGLHGEDYALNIKTTETVETDDPKTLTIIAGVDLSAYSTEGKIGIDGAVNVDFPEPIDNILKELFPELYVNGIGTNAFFAKYDEMVAAIEARGYSTEILAQLRTMLAKLNAANLTFNETVKPAETGLYAVITMVCDPDYKFDADTGLIAISPNATVAELDFNADMPTFINAEVLPSDTAADFDFGAHVGEFKSTNSSLAAGDIVVNDVIFGLTTGLDLFIGSSKDAPSQMGIYDQIAYVPTAENNMMAVLPIHRDFLITDSTANVVFIDPNDNENYLRDFTYDGMLKDMGASIKLADGTILDIVPELWYLGVQNGVVFYSSSEAPTNAGYYQVIGRYFDASQNIFTVGLGALRINPKEVTVEVDNLTMTVGDEKPTLTYTVKGLVKGDTLNVTLATDADITVAGTYDITATLGENPNYKVTVVNGTLTVEEKQITGEIIDTGRSLSLDGVIYINQYVKVEGFKELTSAYIAENGGMLIWDHEITEAEAVYDSAYDMPGLIIAGDEYMQRTAGIAAKEYGDVVYLRVYIELPNGEYVYGPLKEYSVRIYCQNQIAKKPGSELANTCIAMLHYGAAAQVYFDYKLDDLANVNIVDDYPSVGWDATLIDTLDPFTTNITASNAITDRGRSLSLDGAIVVNCYYGFDGVAKEAELLVWDGVAGELTVENASYTVDMQLYGNEYHAQTNWFAAKEYGKTIYVCAHFVDENGVHHYSNVVAYSPEEYARRIIAKNSNPELVDLVQKMVIYGEFARIYFN